MYSIFLSHNSKDKPIVRKISNDLKRANIKIWIDEAEIKLGDSLIDKISSAIKQMDYLGVVLSKNSVSSEWVKKEVTIALNEEISGKRPKVLPILIEPCDIPYFLQDKLYADFSSPEKYISGLQLILDRLVPDLLLDAKNIVATSKKWQDAEQQKQKILSIWKDEKLLSEIPALFTDIVIPALKKLKNICNEIPECYIDEEIRQFLLSEAKNDIDSQKKFSSLLALWHIRNDEVDNYIINHFQSFEDDIKKYFLEEIYENPDLKYLDLIERLLKSNNYNINEKNFLDDLHNKIKL